METFHIWNYLDHYDINKTGRCVVENRCLLEGFKRLWPYHRQRLVQPCHHFTMSRSWIVVCLWRAWAGVHHHSSWNQPPPRDMAAFPTWRNVILAERELYTFPWRVARLGFFSFLVGNTMGIPVFIYLNLSILYIDLYLQLLLWRGTISMEIPLVEVEEFTSSPFVEARCRHFL